MKKRCKVFSIFNGIKNNEEEIINSTCTSFKELEKFISNLLNFDATLSNTEIENDLNKDSEIYKKYQAFKNNSPEIKFETIQTEIYNDNNLKDMFPYKNSVLLNFTKITKIFFITQDGKMFIFICQYKITRFEKNITFKKNHNKVEKHLLKIF